MKVKILFLIFMLEIAALQKPENFIAKFEEWASKHGKCIKDPIKYQKKFVNFVNALFLITKQELKFKTKKSLFKMDLNMNSADTPEEKVSRRGLKDPEACTERVAPRQFPLEFGPTPLNMDYRTLGYVTDVQDQGYCGSCYAFASTCALEGQMFKKYGKLTSLSEQNIVDCSRNVGNGNWGCDGGYAEATYDYVRLNNGIDSSLFYPYQDAEGTCRYDPTYVAGNATGYERLYVDEKTLKKAVASIGPMVVGVNADFESFYGYSNGIYDDKECSGIVNHAVCLVGYGTDFSHGKPVDYWIIKNSWSSGWGENGFMRILRGSNLCNITSYVVYPIV